MLDDTTLTNDSADHGSNGADASGDGSAARAPRKRAVKKASEPAKKAAAKKSAKKAAKKTADEAPASASASAPASAASSDTSEAPPNDGSASAGGRATKKAAAKKAAKKATTKKAAKQTEADAAPAALAAPNLTPAAGLVLFQPPDLTAAPPRKRARKASAAAGTPESSTDRAASQSTAAAATAGTSEPSADPTEGPADGDSGTGDGPRKRRRRGGRGRRGGSGSDGADGTTEPGAEGEPSAQAGGGSDGGSADGESDGESDGDADGLAGDGESSSSRRRRRRRRSGGGSDATPGPDDPPNTVVRVRERRPRGDEITGVRGSTRLEAKKQRRREGREQGRRKQVITEAEFLARRESVERVMVVRQTGGRTQIGVLEDDVLVEHYVSRDAAASMAGNVYLGRVQNVLPSMEAAFVDIGKGRNAVLYAGEVNWDVAGLAGQAKRIENVLKSGESVLVQVTKDPIGHKGARLTSQISLPGRYLVYVPQGSMTGISRKLPENERARLKQILKAVLPEGAGVIVRTAAEGASEEELRRDVERLTSQWEAIQAGAAGNATAPALLHGEPDLTVRVIRDVFNEDFSGLVVSGKEAWQTVESYVEQVAPDLTERLSQWTAEDDVFTKYRIDEQLAKALDRKVWLPSGGSLVIDRTEAMTVVDVNTGKFTGSGGNLEETVTKNNIEAAEEIVRQLRLRDVGGIIVIDFIDMVLESNRDLVLRRLLECLGRDRTKHQVAEVTSLGLVQMTRKRVGQGLLEVFSETCEVCHGRGILVHSDPVEKKSPSEPVSGNGGNAGGSGGSGKGSGRRGGRKAAEPAPVRTGPTAAEIAARAHAAALHNAKVAEAADPDEVAEDDHGSELEPVEAGHEPDHEPDHGLGHGLGHDDDIEFVQLDPVEGAPAEPEPDLQPEAEPEPEPEPEPERKPEAEVEPERQPEPEPEPQRVTDASPAAQPADEVDPTIPVERPKRRRGRVTAPAGPPRPVGTD